MSSKQTNKQTSACSSWWSITAYNDELEMLKRLQNEGTGFPDFVVKIVGGEEECPKTKRRHFQGALQTKWCRFTQIKKWLPTAHIEKAYQKEALQRYCMKEETAVGVKTETENEDYINMPNLMTRLIYLHRVNSKELPEVYDKKQCIIEWECLVCEYLKRYGLAHISLLTDQRTFRTWKMTARCLFSMLQDGKL